MRDTLEKEQKEEESTISTVVGTLFHHHDSLQNPAQFTLRVTGLCANPHSQLSTSKHMPRVRNIIVGSGAVGSKMKKKHAGASGRIGGANRAVGNDLERRTGSGGDRGNSAAASGGQGSRRGPGWADGSPSTVKWRD